MRTQHHLARLVMAAILIFGVALWSPQPASAASFTVNSNGDAADAHPGDGTCATIGVAAVCTLRAAIEEANALAGADTITIPAMTITLSKELEVGENLSITGAGESQTVIDGNQVTRVFHFTFANKTTLHSLSNLTIRNAKTTSSSDPSNELFRQGFGGAILNESAQLTLSHVTLTGNRATQGAGVYNTYTGNGQFVHKLILDNVTVSNNSATGATSSDLGTVGGGLFNGSLLEGNAVTVSGNSATQGGGVFNNSFESLTLTNFAVSGNTAKIGGGVMNDLGTLVDLRDGEIRDNVSVCCDANGQPSGGAGIYNNGADEYLGTINLIKLTDVQVIGNVSQSVGGYGAGITNMKNMLINNVVIAGNRATYGAGVYNRNRSNYSNTMVMTNTTISGNQGSDAANSSGGGLFNVGAATLTLNNVTVTANWAAAGGGFDNRAALTLHNTIVAGNTAALFSPDCRSAATSNGYNVLGSSACVSGLGSGDQVAANPLLYALADNGGGTLTHALQPGSPAIDHGGGACPTTDQRGFLRPVDGDGDDSAVCDVGALETVAYRLTGLNPGRTVTGGGSFTLVVRGTGFRTGLRVQWNGSDRTTTFVSATELQAAISRADIAADGRIAITVSDPNQRGALTNSLQFYVGPPVQPRAFAPVILSNCQ
jgi:CSLREA domain-containing protein